MKILFTYLRPFKWLVLLVLVLAAMNIGFSLFDPIIFGNLVNLANDYAKNPTGYAWSDFFTKPYNSVLWLLLASIGVAMISRIAKNFQDYFLNVVIQKVGAMVFSEGLQHEM